MTRDEWRRAVKAARILRGETIEELATAIFYSPNYVTNIISGTFKSRRAEAAISAHLGIDPPTDI